MIYQKLSKRQLLALTWWNRPAFKHLDGLICDGSVRSGKTVSMSVGFVLWSMACFDGAVFGICGKTIESLRRNVITQLPSWLEGVVSIRERRNENKLVITAGGRTNSYYLFGGRDESSYTLIQGITLAGVLFDEVALMPRSFVEQAIARCSVDGSKFWFNCNPEGPSHWFYQEWVLKPLDKKVLHLHFTMADNLSLSEDTKKRYERLYSGVFYDRYIRGLWVVAEGLVYPMFDTEKHVYTDAPWNVGEYGEYYISVDYGTLNPTSMGLWRIYKGVAYREAEYYYSGRDNKYQLTDEEYYTALAKLAGDKQIQCVIVDPSAASFIATIRRHGRFAVRQANNAVLDGIRTTATALNTGRIRIHENCKAIIREFGAYCWDDKKGEDAIIKESDHAMDDMRYLVMTILRRQMG